MSKKVKQPVVKAAATAAIKTKDYPPKIPKPGETLPPAVPIAEPKIPQIV